MNEVTIKICQDYEAQRNSLLPLAEARADAEHPEPAGANLDELAAWSKRWDAAFHRAMALLTSDPFTKGWVH